MDLPANNTGLLCVPPNGADRAPHPADAWRDAARRPRPPPRARVAVLLRLSALPPPGPRRYHRRIAHAVLDETAQRHAGQVFLLRGGDAVLLCRDSGEPVRFGDPLAHPHALPRLFARLLEADLPDGTSLGQQLTTVWRLEERAEALLAYAENARAALPRVGGRQAA